MKVGADGDQAVAKVNKPDEPNTMKDLVLRYEDQIQKALAGKDPQRFIRIITTAISQNPDLATCSRGSFMGAMFQTAQLGLEPNTPQGEAYIIPYWNNKKKVREAQLQIGYRGLTRLAYETGEYQAIYAMPVYANDEFSYRYGSSMALDHVPADYPEGEPTHYYAFYRLVNGGFSFKVWTRDKVLDHAIKYSQTWNKAKGEFYYGTPWRSEFDAMAQKTVLRELLKTAPIASAVLGNAVGVDGMVSNVASQDLNKGDITITTSYEVQEDDHDEARPADIETIPGLQKGIAPTQAAGAEAAPERKSNVVRKGAEAATDAVVGGGNDSPGRVDSEEGEDPGLF
ncbi:RecT-like ssDNA annealing protein [Rhodobacteraceae phage LS06-2018-MD07]|jgi:recombination protein RecT|nr:RecT-like ssDNA annealing protein [Rhodobacteraceae phage LS06-2018-MD07]